MVNLNNYIIEKFKISKNISADSSSLAEQLYCRLLPNNYEQKDKVIEVLNDWIEGMDIEDINKDIFYTYSNKDRIEKVVQDKSFLKFSSEVKDGYVSLIKKLKLNDMISFHFRVFGLKNDKVRIYMDNNRLLFIYGDTSARFNIYMNAWKKQ